MAAADNEKLSSNKHTLLQWNAAEARRRLARTRRLSSEMSKQRKEPIVATWPDADVGVAGFGLLVCDDNRLGTQMVVFLV